MKNFILIITLIAAVAAQGEEVNIVADSLRLGSDFDEVREFSSLRCKSLTISGKAKIINPDANKENPEKINILCDEIIFERGSELRVHSNLQLRSKLISGFVTIIGDRLERNGDEGIDRESVTHGTPGSRGANGNNGEDARLNRGSTSGDTGVAGTIGTNGRHGSNGSLGSKGHKNVIIDIRTDAFARDAIINIESVGGIGGRGGHGSAGGNGGNGGNGGHGGNGGDANGWLGQSASTGGAGGEGGAGGNGGNGGDGGNGGKGGDGGDVFLLVNSEAPNEEIIPRTSPNIYVPGGRGGSPGTAGSGGNGGIGGQGGTGGSGGEGELLNGEAGSGPSGPEGSQGKKGLNGEKGRYGVDGERGEVVQNVTGFYKMPDFPEFDSNNFLKSADEELKWIPFNEENLRDLF